MKKLIIFLLILNVTGLLAQATVKVWQQPLTLPTYKLGAPDPNPMFYNNESYQGAQRKIYPYPLMDHLTSVREPQTYQALYLENEYIQLCLLPEIGGRLFSAVDKTNQYDFFYHQHVIKPALIGMLGAWISGGIEWCVFHHHRNTTHMPVDYTLVENADGSKTIWFGETERRHRMKWLIGLTLYPGKSYIEATIKMDNRTAVPHSILYWANVAVHVNDAYQIIFPASVNVATYHSKNAFTRWPISSEVYRGVDYRGVDLSWWKNHPNAVSFFAWNLQEDFMGGYDHGKKAGVVHIGDHHIVCGAKLWEWAPDNIWDTRVLTDADGPYAELMVGAYSDNQPDYSWIKPYEVKVFKQYWYPVRDIGGFDRANLEGAVNLQVKPGKLVIGFNTTSAHKHARVVVSARGEHFYEQVIDISPARPFVKDLGLTTGIQETDLKACLLDANNDTLISYQPVTRKPVEELPEVVKAPPAPKDLETIEELYLTGLRIDQIHNPTIDPFDYYREALRRDPGDSRTNTIVGSHYLKQGLYQDAATYLRQAIKRISAEYTRPGNTEALYYLGLALKSLGQVNAAMDTLYRATWDYAFHSAAYYQLATLSCRKGNFDQALAQLDHSRTTNTLNSRILNLKAILLRKLNRTGEAQEILNQVLASDPLNFMAMNEMVLCHGEAGTAGPAQKLLTDLEVKMRGEVQSYLELACDYMDCGCWQEAIDVLLRPVAAQTPCASTYPMLYYYLGYLYQQQGQDTTAADYYVRAATMPPDYCFPFRLESIDVLQAAIKVNPNDARAHYYLGNLFYDMQPEAALTCWEKSRELDGTLAIVHRNLGWGYLRQHNDVTKAVASYEQAIACNNSDPRYYLELDDIYQRANTAPEKRLALLEQNQDLVLQRKGLLIREISLLVQTDQYDRAIEYLANNTFYTSEGGGRELRDAYTDAHLLRGLERLQAQQYDQALDDFLAAAEFPDNLSVEQPENDPRAPQLYWFIGTAYQASGQQKKAREFYRKSADQNVPVHWSEARFYQAMAMTKLGAAKQAQVIFDELIDQGRHNLSDEVAVDFFAKFGEQATKPAQWASAHYTLGLGLLGKGQPDQAKQEFDRAIRLHLSHIWARYHLAQL